MPVLLAGGFALGAAGLMITDRRIAMNECRARLLDGQRRAAAPMRRLLALNPAAKSLRLRAAQLAAVIAANAGNPGVTVPTAAQLAAVRRQQAKLDRLQKILFAEALTQMQAAQSSALLGIGPDSAWLRVAPLGFTAKRPAIRPDDPGLAPEWSKAPGFAAAQTMEQKWLWSFRVRGPAANFLRAAHIEEEKCAATLNDTRDPWVAEIR